MNIEDLFRIAADKQASDLLLNTGGPPIFRIDGELVPSDGRHLQEDDIRALTFGFLTAEQIEKFEQELELDFAVEYENCRYRGNLFVTRKGISCVFRLLGEKIPSLAELGLPPILANLALEKQGLFLVVGPTGHGKSTTLAAIIDLINRNRKAHIVTIEDPIEFVHQNRTSVVNQRQVGSSTHSFPGALRHVLRQSPDVILIGELRDLETISAALTAAETGHLVLATLHTNDAAQTVDRLIDVFPPHQQAQVRTQLAMVLLAVLSQRLVPRINGGRVVATELLRRTNAMAAMIREGNCYQLYSLIETQARLGMHTMDSSLKNLYSKGIISYEEARGHMRDPSGLDSLKRDE